MMIEQLVDGHEWLRIADSDWADPLDPSFAEVRGGRWNPPNSFPVLYLNEDIVTARINIRAFVSEWPYEPEDLRTDNAPLLVGAILPVGQRAVDVHTPKGVTAVNLPLTYPLDATGTMVTHETCRPIGVKAERAGHDGIRCRCAQSPDGEGRELAWFAGTSATRDLASSRRLFTDWYWG